MFQATDIAIAELSYSAIRGALYAAWKTGKINKYSRGRYYYGAKRAADFAAIKAAYIASSSRTFGYALDEAFYRFFSLPYPGLKVVSNKEKSRGRKVKIGATSFVLEAPKIPVTRRNYRALMLFDLITGTDLETLRKRRRKIERYIELHRPFFAAAASILGRYPARTSKKLVVLELTEIFNRPRKSASLS